MKKTTTTMLAITLSSLLMTSTLAAEGSAKQAPIQWGDQAVAEVLVPAAPIVPAQPIIDEETTASPAPPAMGEEMTVTPAPPAMGEETTVTPEQPAIDEEMTVTPEQPAIDEEMTVTPEQPTIEDEMTVAPEELVIAEDPVPLAEMPAEAQPATVTIKHILVCTDGELVVPETRELQVGDTVVSGDLSCLLEADKENGIAMQDEARSIAIDSAAMEISLYYVFV